MGSIANLTKHLEPAKSWPGIPAGVLTSDWENLIDGEWGVSPHYIPPDLPRGEEHFPGVRFFRAVSAWMDPPKAGDGYILLVLHWGGPGDCDTIVRISDDAVLTEQVTAALDYVRGRKRDWAEVVATARKQRR